MPRPPLPPELDQFLLQPNPSVIATLRGDGSPHTAATWYLWENGRVLVNMDEGRTRLEYLRKDPRVSITVLGQDDWYHHVRLRGRVASLEDDARFPRHRPHLAPLHRRAYPQRDRGRISAWIKIERWHAWAVGEPWRPED